MAGGGAILTGGTAIQWTMEFKSWIPLAGYLPFLIGFLVIIYFALKEASKAKKLIEETNPSGEA